LAAGRIITCGEELPVGGGTACGGRRASDVQESLCLPPRHSAGDVSHGSSDYG